MLNLNEYEAKERNYKEKSNSGKKYRLEMDTSVGMIKISMDDVVKNDQGNYTLVVKNFNGKTSKNITLSFMIYGKSNFSYILQF